MVLFAIERDTALSTEDAWQRLTDWESHGRHIPLTVVTTCGSGLGSTLKARTSVGPLGFDDPMEVTDWHPPVGGDAGHCRIEKRGRVVTGWAELSVAPTASGAHVRWVEEASVRRTGRVLDLPARLLSKRVFGRLVDRLLAAEPEQQSPR